MFRPERLALHEILVRITADYEIPDPEDASVLSLGINFRHMVNAISTLAIDPNRAELTSTYQGLKLAISDLIEGELRAACREPGIFE